ncbi:MAG: FecR domain-containing protein [Pseudomonadota bacterium]
MSGDQTIITQALAWRAKMNDDQLSDEDLSAFQSWLTADPGHASAYDYASQFWTSMDRLTPENLGVMEAPVGGLDDSRTAAAGRGPGRRPAIAAWAGALAAAVLVAVVAVFLTSPDNTELSDGPPAVTYETAIGEVKTVTLSDGTTLDIGPDSRVRVRLDGRHRSAQVRKGEVFFSVAADPKRSFEVSADSLTLSVLGTAFNVRVASGTAQLAVSEGLVAVRRRQSAGVAGAAPGPLELSAGERVAVARDGTLSAVELINIDLIGAWRSNRLVYLDAPLHQIVEDINRFQPRRILIVDPQVRQLRLSATFDSADVDGVLDTLVSAFPLRVDLSDPDRILIRSAP